MSGGGRFDFDDGGTYVGGWEDGKAHGHGVCTGPKGQGEYSGAWQFGFEISGVYSWPSGNNFEGQWMQGKRHGLGRETKGRWLYRGEWTQGFKGRYGVRQSTSSGAKYEGTWTTGLQDGYGVESYADGGKTETEGGTYQGQWLRGMRHGYGVRQSVPYGLASHYRPKALRDSLTSLRSEQEEDNVVKERDRKIDESRGGFVLRAKSDDSPGTRRRSIFDKQGRSSLRNTLARGLRLKKQRSTGDIQESPRRPTGSVRSTISNISHASADSAQSGVTSASMYTDSNASFVSQDDITDVNVTETYMGEWKNDKRSGFGISERSDGLKYEGEWYNNKKFGYGVTIFKDGAKEDGKYKNNVLISSGKKSKIFLLRSSKLKDRVDNAVAAAQRAAQIALQKADIALSRMANARAKAEQADMAAEKAQQDSDMARLKAKQYAPEFHQPGTDILKKRLQEQGGPTLDYMSPKPTIMANHSGPGPGLGVGGGPDGMHPPQRSRSMLVHSPSTHREDSLPPGQTVKPRDISSDAAHRNGPSQLTDNLPQGGGYDRGGYNRYEPDHGGGLNPGPSERGGGPALTPDHRYEDDRNWQNRSGRDQPITQQRRPSQYGAPPQRAGQSPQYDYGRQPNGGRFSEMLNSTVVSDHFDQYRTRRDDSGLGGDLNSPDFSPTEDRNNMRAFHHDPKYGTPDRHPNPKTMLQGGLTMPSPMDRSPDSGVSDTDDIYRSKTRPLQRRKTLPSIVKHTHPQTNKPDNKAKSKPVVGDSVQSQRNLSQVETDTYIIENGIRKRVKAEAYNQPLMPSSSVENLEKPKELPKRYKLETPSKLRKGANRGSLPDVSACREMEQKGQIMAREEVHVLSQQRREELRRLREEAERRRQQEIVLRLGDLKDWCQQRQLLMLVITLNVTLATMFFNLLSQ